MLIRCKFRAVTFFQVIEESAVKADFWLPTHQFPPVPTDRMCVQGICFNRKERRKSPGITLRTACCTKQRFSVHCVLCRWLRLAADRRGGPAAQQKSAQRQWTCRSVATRSTPRKSWKPKPGASRQRALTHLHHQEHGAKAGRTGLDEVMKWENEIDEIVQVRNPAFMLAFFQSLFSLAAKKDKKQVN